MPYCHSMSEYGNRRAENLSDWAVINIARDLGKASYGVLDADAKNNPELMELLAEYGTGGLRGKILNGYGRGRSDGARQAEYKREANVSYGSWGH